MLGDVRLLRLFRVLAVLLVGVVVIRVAWVSDDALITLRTALNISHNWGPGFNATESVQSFTHPLWFLLWVWVGSWTNQWILGVIALSVVFVVIATALLVQRVSSLPRLVIVTGFLLLSNAFIDFTTSGLENPLAYAVIAVLLTLSIRKDPAGSTPWWWAALAGLTTAAVVLTRLDLATLIALPLALLMWQYRANVRVIVIGLAAFLAPLVVWFTWSYLTYAALLPNTFAAKTNAEIPRGEFIIQGLRYLWVSFENDPVTMIGLAVGIGMGLTLGPRMLRAWAGGGAVYIGYVVWIGGDFMGGRFLAVPFFVAIFVLAALPLGQAPNSESAQEHPPNPEHNAMLLAGAGVVVALLVIGSTAAGIRSTSLANPQEERWGYVDHGVADERGFYVSQGHNLKGMVDNLSLAFTDPDFVPISDLTGVGRPLRNLDKSAKNWPVNDGTFTLPAEVGVVGQLGWRGIATGPTVHLIDPQALTDRYLAAKPFVPAAPFDWRPGHFNRAVSDDYIEAVATDDPMRMRDTAEAWKLQKLWEQIRRP